MTLAQIMATFYHAVEKRIVETFVTAKNLQYCFDMKYLEDYFGNIRIIKGS